MFGLSLTLALTVLGFSPVRHGHTPRWWAIDAAALFLAVALCRPSLLGPLAEVWAKLLRPVNAVVTWVTMGLLFGLVIVPAGLGRRFVVRIHSNSARIRRRPVTGSRAAPPTPFARAWSINFKEDEVSLARELWAFLRVRKKFWLLPVIIMALVFGAFLMLAQTSAIAPFIYKLF